MNLDQAIKTLQALKAKKEQQKLDENSNAFAKSLNTFKNIIIGAMADLTVLLLQNEPRVSIKNFPKKIEISNKEVPVRFSDITIASTINDLSKNSVEILKELKKMNKHFADKEKMHKKEMMKHKKMEEEE